MLFTEIYNYKILQLILDNKCDLSNSSLLKIDNNLFNFSNLIELNLSENQLSFISEKIKNLQHLKTLNLSDNLIEELSSNIGNIVELENLFLSGNKLKELPQTIIFTARLDLSETIFGFSKKINEEQKSLKGRVVFSHGFSKENKRIELLETRNILLGSPKASYYPIYLIQNGKEYKTLMDEESVLAGWKRYPIHKNFSHKGEVKSKQTNTITPIKENSIFKCKIKVHNLKPIEIGALLSALTFHNTKNCFHSIGMGKSCGYGKVEIEVSNLKNFKYSNIDYMKFFEASLNGDLFDKKIFWHKSEQIVNLLTMATEQNDSNLKYMELKDFASNKNKNEDGTYNYLDRYVNLNGVKKTETNSLVEESDIVYYEDYIQKYKKFYFGEEERKKIIEEKKRKKEEVKAQLEKDWNIVISSTNIDTLKNFIEKYPNELEKLGKINQTISKLEDKEKQEKEEKRQKEANEKWLSIKKLESKFMQKALEDFISNYPYFKDIAIVQKELENFSKSSKSSSTNISIDDLANAKDGKKVKSILEKLSIDENNISKIISSIKEVYSNMKPKDQKSFFKDAQLGRFIGKESEEELKNFFN